MQINIPVIIDSADFAILGDTDAERAEQLKTLISSSLDELIRFYKFINAVHAIPNQRAAKGGKAPKDSQQQGDGAK